MLRSELTEPFAALLGDRHTAQVPETAVETANVDRDVIERHPADDVSVTMFGEVRGSVDTGNGEQSETPSRETIFSERGWNTQVLVGAVGIEPTTARV